jgi:hypothetical protein
MRGAAAAIPDDIAAYLDLTADGISRLILCLLIEEFLEKRLATFRRPSVGEWVVQHAALPKATEATPQVSPTASP